MLLGNLTYSYHNTPQRTDKRMRRHDLKKEKTRRSLVGPLRYWTFEVKGDERASLRVASVVVIGLDNWTTLQTLRGTVEGITSTARLFAQALPDLLRRRRFSAGFSYCPNCPLVVHSPMVAVHCLLVAESASDGAPEACLLEVLLDRVIRGVLSCFLGGADVVDTAAAVHVAIWDLLCHAPGKASAAQGFKYR